MLERDFAPVTNIAASSNLLTQRYGHNHFSMLEDLAIPEGGLTMPVHDLTGIGPRPSALE